MGGGGKSFMGWIIPHQMTQTVNGNFMTSSISPTQVIITGTGSEVVTGNDSIKVQTIVTADDYYTVIIN